MLSPVRGIAQARTPVYAAPMAFIEGQQVRLKRGQQTGKIDRKLSYLADMYVVLLDGKRTPSRMLAHESELELILQSERLTA